MSKHVARIPLVVGTAGAVGLSATAYSESVSFRKATGIAAALLISSSAGVIDIVQQVSMDNKNWYDPVDTSVGAVGIIVSDLPAATGWVTFDPVMTPYARFKVTEKGSGATTVTLELLFQEEV